MPFSDLITVITDALLKVFRLSIMRNEFKNGRIIICKLPLMHPAVFVLNQKERKMIVH